MQPIGTLTVIFSLVASPVLAGMLQVQEADEAATCELRSAGMVTPAPENSVIFPQDANCAGAEADSRELPNEEGTPAIAVAGYTPTASE